MQKKWGLLLVFFKKVCYNVNDYEKWFLFLSRRSLNYAEENQQFAFQGHP